MVMNNLRYYKNMLVSGTILFSVEAMLSSPEIVLHPHANELLKLMTRVMRDIAEG